MKKIFTLIILLAITKISLAQAPQEFNYQGVARNAQGQALANQPIKVKATLIKEDPTHAFNIFYSETRSLTTNQLGLFSFKVNDKSASTKTGNFEDGEWLNPEQSQHLKIELDVNNSGTWTDMGTQKISSVPYSMYAGTATVAKDLNASSYAFGATSTTSQTIAAGSSAKISFEVVEAKSSMFNTTTSEFTATDYGVHYFDFTVHSSFAASATGTVSIHLMVNGVQKRYFRFDVNGLRHTATAGANIILLQGDKVSLTFNNSTGSSATVGAESTYFNGFNVR